MSSSFQKKSSQIFLTLFIGIIVISFVMSGPFFGTGTPDTIGTVGSHDIKVREFNAEIQRQSQFYAQIFKGGQPLTSNELEQYKVYDSAVRNLVSSKLRLILAEEAGMAVGSEAIKEDIKKAPYFLTNGQFDLSKYKTLLAYNQLTPEDFEADTLNRLRDQKLQALATDISFSSDLLTTLNTLYKDKRLTDIITINADDIKKTLEISKKEISDYLAQDVNKKRVEAAFNSRKESLSQKEQIQARHILITVKDGKEKDALAKAENIKKDLTVKNFMAMAKKFTDEPSGKTTGGNLNWVSRGQMVPEFEKALFAMKAGQISGPVKTEFGYHLILAEAKKEAKEANLIDFETKIAKEFIQKEKDVKDLVTKATEEVTTRLNSGKDLKELKKKYSLSLKEGITVNKLEGFGADQAFKQEFVNELFSKEKGVFTVNEGTKVVIVASGPSKDTSKDYDLSQLKNMISSQTMKVMIEKLGESYTFKQNKFARLPNQ
ncbi:SurA N-terminal domain-containing protein [Bacteriovorax sp. Seq25_V]|uniref:peptidylprolyl isomerase n=1 Tax=Bacteriovorax sp. Seq25_V TaxID=1201288 RepID=UPI000389FBD1|nr:SurA N-terminal domain-containing protein [Bacteriovorax sp. Seq25_V]EQC45434.1 PPIC-type PPIASE domain protein [Bacteriovorax sp. Seq25_V]